MSEVLVEDKDTNEELSWHLKGNWGPIKEEITSSDLQVVGEIPSGLKGTYIRNGFNPRSGSSDHWFFGNGMLHSVEISEGKASYKNRYVRTPYYENDDDVMSSFGKLEASPANTHIIEHSGKLLALEETHLPWEVDIDLNTVGVYDFSGELNGAMTAHPRVCPETGELLFFGYSMMGDPFLTYYRVNADGSMAQKEDITLPRAVMMHDWAVTRNYVIFMDLPIVSDMNLAVKTGSPFGFMPECGARLGVMPRNGTNSDIKWFEIDPCFVFHTFNSHEEDGKIVMYVSRQKEAMVGGFQDVYGGETTVGRLWRWTLDLATGQVKEEQLDDSPCDFPRVDDRRMGLKASTGYCLKLETDVETLTLGDCIYKYDLETGERQTHFLGNNVAGGEPIFVPASANSDEQDGYVFCLVHERETRTSKLAIIRADDFESKPVAEILIPQRVPYGAHGSWIPRN